MIKEILLSSGKITFVDEEDYQRVIQYNWWSQIRKNNVWYAKVRMRLPGGERRLVSLHRFIMNCHSDDQIDHIDHDGLNNCKDNLRICTASQNRQNERKRNNTSSQFKGVCWDRNRRMWLARIKVDKKLYNLGRFNSEQQAAKVYDLAAIKHFGPFACLNNL